MLRWTRLLCLHAAKVPPNFSLNGTGRPARRRFASARPAG
jgi:hypothetical protein